MSHTILHLVLARHRLLAWFAGLLTFIGILCLTAFPVCATQKGETAPDFTLRDLDGRNIRLSDYRGKLVLVNFWATWCVPCKLEMPSLEKLYQRFKSNSFEMFPISNDMFGEKVVRPYVAIKNFSFPVLVDPLLKVSNRYGVVTLPTTYLIDPEGNVIGVREGADDWAKPSTFRFFEELLRKTEDPGGTPKSNLQISLDTNTP